MTWHGTESERKWRRRLTALVPQIAPHVDVAPRRWIRKPGLDGIRALAVLGVVAYHYEGSHLPGGYFGVTAFFVLSGYLISGMLTTEYANSGRIDLVAFYARRALRLFPALLVVVVGALLLATLVGHDLADTRLYEAGGFSLLYVNDFAVAAGHVSSMLDLTWSLGVEEQFYLLWPLLLLVALGFFTSRTIGLACLALAALAGTLEGFLVPTISPGVAYFSPLGNIMPLMLGTGISFAATTCSERLIGWLASGGAIAIIALALAGPSLATTASWHGPEQLAAISVAFVILHVANGGFCLLRSRIAIWIGRRSYGLYLIHEPVHVALFSLLRHSNEDAAIGVPISIGLAALSYHYVEQPFLRLKARFSRTSSPPRQRGAIS
jgi:peptidoglycan/LPS O-acetylase OafA/YrhL